MSLLRLLTALLLLPLAACATAPAPLPAGHPKRIAITFDDAPRSPGAFFSPDERTARLIDGLKRAGVAQAAFFLNPGNLQQPFGAGGERRLAAYVAAGHVLANHSNTHPALSQTDTAAYIADIDRAAAWLNGRAGYRPWFRYPFLDEGGADAAKRDAVRAALRERGLLNGYMTASNSDWHLENLTLEAKAKGETMDMDALRDLYVRTMVRAADAADAQAVKAIGRSPIHVLLLHETDLAALFLADAMAALRADGWEIVTADAAYADPIAKAGGLPTGLPAPDDIRPDALTRAFQERVLHRTVAQ